MNMDQAAAFLAGSILLGLGCIALVVTAVAINNIIAKYWKPVKIFTPDSWKAFNPPQEQFASQEELQRIAPHLEEAKKEQTK